MITSLPTAAHTISAPATSEEAWLATMAQTVGQASRPTWRTVPRGRIAKCRPRGQRESLLSLTCLLALPQARFPGADDRLRPVSNLQLGEDVGDVVANGLQHVA